MAAAAQSIALAGQAALGYFLGNMPIEQNLGGGRLGGIALRGRAVMAPLSGVTDVAFRRIAQRFGASLVVSEMVASDDYVRGAAEARLRAEGDRTACGAARGLRPPLDGRSGAARGGE